MEIPFEHDRDTNVGLIAMVGALGIVGFVLVVILLEAWFYNWREDLAAAKAIAPNDPRTALGQMLVAQQEQLAGYRWIDYSKGVCALPIERAMDLVGEELATTKSGSSEASHDKH